MKGKRVRISIPEKFSWILMLDHQAKNQLFKRLLEERFSGLTEEEALTEAYRLIVCDKDFSSGTASGASHEREQGNPGEEEGSNDRSNLTRLDLKEFCL